MYFSIYKRFKKQIIYKIGMTKKSQKVKNNFKSRKNNKKFIKDKNIKNFLLQHLKPQKIDFDQVKNCILNNIYEDDDIIRNNKGLNTFPAITTSILNDLGIFESKEKQN